MKQEENKKKNYIVGIGASAGGLEALQKLFSALPSTTGFPYIVVQHLSPDYKSLLGEILSKYTDMPVIQAEENMVVEPNNVYIIQPGKNMRIEDGKLTLVDQVPKELNLPIDIFFRSLAEDAGSHAISIILSGTGSDGTNGIKAIKENGGFVIVQNIDSSKFDGMPNSALRTGLVDAQLSPSEIAMELQHIAGSYVVGDYEKTIQEIDSELLKKVYSILKKVSNINFTHYKQTTILRRIERRMMITHKDHFVDYVSLLQESPEEVRILSKEVLIGVTSFFRDPKFFEVLKDKVITNILNDSSPEETIRVWVAGCSTGEEAYSIAILFSEMMDSLKIKRNIKIFATDLDTEAISTAGKGIYGDNIIDTVSTIRLSKYFTKKANTYVINRDIRKMIVFSPHNVFQDPPFVRLDLISCRNMLIYFQPVLQNDLFSVFHQALKDKGYLFLGRSESVGAYTDAFPIIDPTAKIFSHNIEARIANNKKVPYLQTALMEEDYQSENDYNYGYTNDRSERDFQSSVTIDNSILEQFLPPCVVINEKNELVYTYGNTKNIIHLSKGKYSNNLFDLITEALKIPVSTLLKESRDKRKLVQYRDIHFAGENKNSIINLTVSPASKKNHELENLYAIVFSEINEVTPTSEDSVSYDIDSVASQRITDLEQELLDKQSKLDQSVYEQETVNEELQAANEELLTANEELQSSNEELQSVNEELYTVNSEYQEKLTELSDLNDDIANFLSSTLTGIIFVDNKLNIKRYTDYVTSEFSVMDHDIGRSLAFISYHFPLVDITEICTNVLKTLMPDEREITTNKKKVFFMRVAPYRSTEDKILGCVITLMDITTQKMSQMALMNTEKKLTIAQQSSDAKSNYLSHIINEIRKPVETIANIVKEAGALNENNEQIQGSLKSILEMTNYLSSLVTDISDISSYENYSSSTDFKPFSLKSVLNVVYEITKVRMKDAGLHYKLIIDDDLSLKFVGDKVKIQQILINIITNSIKRSELSGIISLKVFEEKIDTRKSNVYLVVSDTGSVLTNEYVNNLFKPFQLENINKLNTLDDVEISLLIAYNQLQSINGNIEVSSAEGKGTTFTICVPLRIYDNQDKNEENYEADEEVDLKGIHVMIAEDNELNRIILCSILDKEEITYTAVCDGDEAVKAFIEAPEYTFDCILMDMKMPKLDGIKATIEIRNSSKLDADSIPIIGVSANGFPDDVQKAKKAGIDEYTTKPIDRNVLFQVISKLVNKDRKNRRNKK